MKKAFCSCSDGLLVNGLNQYTSVAGASLGYDKHGNLTSLGGNSYGYDSFNRLGEFNGGFNAGNWLYYDGVGRLNWSNATQSRFDYDGSRLITELDGNGTIRRRYVYGPNPDEPVVWYEGAGTGDKRFIQTDERGSVTRVQRADGSTLAVSSYDEYGVPASGNQGRFGYTGQTWLPELGLWNYKARMYAPTLGRFMQIDPIGYGDGLNWHNYAHGDPVNLSDPTGLSGGGSDDINTHPAYQNKDPYPTDPAPQADQDPCSFDNPCGTLTARYSPDGNSSSDVTAINDDIFNGVYIGGQSDDGSLGNPQSPPTPQRTQPRRCGPSNGAAALGEKLAGYLTDGADAVAFYAAVTGNEEIAGPAEALALIGSGIKGGIQLANGDYRGAAITAGSTIVGGALTRLLPRSVSPLTAASEQFNKATASAFGKAGEKSSEAVSEPLVCPE